MSQTKQNHATAAARLQRAFFDTDTVPAGPYRADLALDRASVSRRPLRWWDPRGPIGCWVIIASLWTYGWGRSTVAALEVLAGAPLPVMTERGIWRGLAEDVILVVASLVVLAIYRGRPIFRAPTPGRPVLIARATASYMALIAAGFLAVTVVAVVFQLERLPGQPTPPGLEVLAIVRAAMAGPTEELMIVGVVVWALRSNGYRWWVVLACTVALRVPFHAYYGWPAIGMSAWAIGAVLLYRRTGALVALVLGHTLWNVLVSDPFPGSWIVQVALVTTGVSVVVRHLKRVEREAQAKT